MARLTKAAIEALKPYSLADHTDEELVALSGVDLELVAKYRAREEAGEAATEAEINADGPAMFEPGDIADPKALKAALRAGDLVELDGPDAEQDDRGPCPGPLRMKPGVRHHVKWTRGVRMLRNGDLFTGADALFVWDHEDIDPSMYEVVREFSDQERTALGLE